MNARIYHRSSAGWIAAAIYAAAYLASLWGLSRFPGFSLVEPLFVLGTMAVAFPALALALTRRARNELPPIRQPGRELGVMLAYLAVFAVAILGFGFSAINAAWPDDPQQSMVKTATKLLTMVALPALLFRAFGHRLGDTLAPRWNWRKHGRALVGVGLALLLFQAVFGRGLTTLRELHPAWSTLAWAIPSAFAWIAFEAGLCEEVLFRVGLQTRLAAWLKSEFAAVCLASLLFGLAHAPGLYLRGASLMEGADAHPTLLWSVAYSIAIISPAGFLFGTLWSRTRSLALIVVLHALTDLLPGLAPFIGTWTGS